MKLHDAIRQDAELRDDMSAILDIERQMTFSAIESLPAIALAQLAVHKSYLDALQKVRFLFFKGDPTRAR